MNMILKLCLKVRKKNIIILKKIIHLYVLRATIHIMECTDMMAKSGAVAGRDQSIHVSLTVRFQDIPNGK